MLINLEKTPFPYFGGKADAAKYVWEALGDVSHYAEPFAGSLAVLLRRPHPANRCYYSETVNDADGLLVNAWRSIQLSPDATAEAGSNPICEADLMARHLAILKWKKDKDLEKLMADPRYHDPEIGGWWIWGISCWIGGGWCDGSGAWVEREGRIAKKTGEDDGVSRRRPHLSDNGKGINRPQAKEPGVSIEEQFHPVTMPEVRRWMAFLSARLRHVRILNGDWKRLATAGALKMLEVRMNKDKKAGIFLDPPYSHKVRDGKLYTVESADVAEEVLEWCKKNGDDEDYRIVLAGYDSEHNELENMGWTSKEWYKHGFLKGGYANRNKEGTQQARERLWLSPHCLRKETKKQGMLF